MKRLLIIALALLFVGAGQAGAAWEYEALPALNPAPDDWNASMAFVENDVLTRTLLLYSTGKDIYGWNPENGETELVVNPTLRSANAAGPAGFALSYDKSVLYFHDNGYPTTYIFQYIFASGATPTTYYKAAMDCEGSIFDLAVNPWTDRLWFVSGDYANGKLYLYEVFGTKNKMAAEFRMELDNALTGGAVGPIIFKGPDTVLLGEASYTEGSGAFHWLYPKKEQILASEYVAIDGGLADAAYGYNNGIFAATGYGMTVEEILKDQAEEVLAATQPVMGMAFDGKAFYVGETHPVSGTVSVSVLSDTEAVELVSPADGYRYAVMSAPDPEFQAWNLSEAYYGDSIYYAGDNGDIYAYNIISSTNELWADIDFSEGSAGAYGASALTTGGDGFLYYHDNGFPTQFLYRNKLSDPSVSKTLVLTNTIQGSIWDMTWNPWTESLWICAANDATDTFYLYEIKQNFTGIEGTGISFPMAHANENTGNGPIVFIDENNLYYGESGWSGSAYFHKVNVQTRKVTKTDAVTFAGGLNAAVYGFDKGIFVSTRDGKAVYKLDPSTNEKTLVAETANSIGDLTFDGSALYLSGNDFLTLWKPWLSGVPDGQAPAASYVLDQTDFCVVTDATGPDVVGIQAGANTTVESFRFINPTTIDVPAGGPYNLPYGLLEFRAKVSEVGGTARVWIRFSSKLASNRQWWKLDPVEGWHIPTNAVFLADGSAIELTIVDGGEGDADGVANGYVTDPSGPGYPEPNDGVTVSDDTSDCFVKTTAQDGAKTATLALTLGLGLLGLAFALTGRKAARS